MRVCETLVLAVVAALGACELPDPEGAQHDVEGMPPQSAQAERSESPPGESLAPSSEPRDAPTGRWQVEAYDERLVWLDAPTMTELVLEFASGVIATAPAADSTIRIEAIGQGAVASEVGLRPRDVLVSVGGKPASVAALHDAWATAQRTEAIDLLTKRGDEERPIRLWIPAAEGEPRSTEVAAALTFVGVSILDEARRMIDRDLLAALDGRDPIARHDAFWRGLGVPVGSRIVSVDGRTVGDGEEVTAFEALASMTEAKAFELVAWQGDEEHRLQYEVGEHIMPESALIRLRAVKASAASPLPPPPGKLPRRGGMSEELAARLESAIEKKGEHHYAVKRGFLDDLLAEPGVLARQVRIVPSVRDGKAAGFKLYAIRPGTVLARLGFNNGDTIAAVGGRTLEGPDDAMEAYTLLAKKKPKSVRFDIVRRGKPIELRIDID